MGGTARPRRRRRRRRGGIHHRIERCNDSVRGLGELGRRGEHGRDVDVMGRNGIVFLLGSWSGGIVHLSEGISVTTPATSMMILVCLYRRRHGSCNLL